MTSHVLVACRSMDDQLSWLEGRWKGQVGDDVVEERWSDAVGGQRYGTFRWVKSGSPWMYEWMVLGAFDGQTQMRLKHFGANAVGWEEKDAWTEFTLVEETGARAVFQQTSKPDGKRLVYERTDDRLRAWFEAEGGQAPVGSVFEYRLT